MPTRRDQLIYPAPPETRPTWRPMPTVIMILLIATVVACMLLQVASWTQAW